MFVHKAAAAAATFLKNSKHMCADATLIELSTCFLPDDQHMRVMGEREGSWWWERNRGKAAKKGCSWRCFSFFQAPLDEEKINNP